MSSAKTVTLSNTGKATLNIASITATGNFAQTSNCKATLTAGKSCTISVTFTPTAGGLRTGTIAISDNAAGSPQRVSLSGNAVTVFPNPLSFGSVTVGSTKALTVTVTNNQSVSITLSASIPAGTFSEPGPGTTCGSTLGANSSCGFVVTFKPAAKKSYSATLSISDSPDPNSPYSVGLSGKGM